MKFSNRTGRLLGTIEFRACTSADAAICKIEQHLIEFPLGAFKTRELGGSFETFRKLWCHLSDRGTQCFRVRRHGGALPHDMPSP